MVFVDTSAFFSRQARRDLYHEAALALWADMERSSLITSDHVIEETLTLFARRLGYGFADIVASRHDNELCAIRFFENSLIRLSASPIASHSRS